VKQERILIIGCSGSGKTTFAKELSAKLGLPTVHLDQLYWQDDWTAVSRPAFNSLLQAELEKPRWIMDGNFNRTLPHRLTYCDTVFYFDLPTTVCLAGATKRILTYYGKSREDMGGNCIERFDRQKIPFYRNILTFRKQHRKTYLEMLANAENTTVVIFKSLRQARRYLDCLLCSPESF